MGCITEETFESLGFPTRARLSLAMAGIHSVSQLTTYTEQDLIQLPSLGKLTLTRIIDCLASAGLSLEPSIEKQTSASIGDTHLNLHTVTLDESKLCRVQYDGSINNAVPEAVNRFLTDVFGSLTQLSDILNEQGFTPEQVALLGTRFSGKTIDAVCTAWVEYLHERLPEKHALVVSRRYGLLSSNPATLAEIGEGLGLSRERIRQLQRNGVGRLRTARRKVEIKDRVRSAAQSVLDGLPITDGAK